MSIYTNERNQNKFFTYGFNLLYVTEKRKKHSRHLKSLL